MKGLKWMLLLAPVALPGFGFADDAETNIVWKSSASLGATYKSGNTEKSLFTMNLKSDRYSPSGDWINSLYSEYGKSSGDQTDGQVRWQSEFRDKCFAENFFAGVFSEAYHDAIKQVRARVKIGPNLGYYFVRTDTMKFDLSGGIAHVYERTARMEGDHSEYSMEANCLWNITKMASCYLNVEYSVDVNDIHDGYGLLIAGLKSTVNEKLSLFIELRDEYNNNPAESDDDLEYNDATVISGLSYSL